jgi:DNA-directed RNA polymerase specialized sigma24 family protein
MSGDITNAAARCREQDPQAPTDLEKALQPFLQEMVRLVRRRRPDHQRPRIDSEGVVNAALQSLLKRAADHRFPELSNRDEVKKLLTTLVKRRLFDEVEQNDRKVRDARRDLPLDGDKPAAAADLLDPTFADWLEELLREVEKVHPRAREVVDLCLAGHTENKEVAARLGVGVRWVQATRKAMKEAWDRARKEKEDEAER